jgi:opacity protein-like surface antigen
MRKRIAIATLSLTTLVTTILAGSAHAQPTMWIGFNGGVGMPIGSFADQASTGFNIGVVADIVVRGPWAFGGELSWHGYGGNDDFEKDLTAVQGEPVDVSIGMIPIIAHARYRIATDDPLVPFVRGGLGLYNIRSRQEWNTGRRDRSATDFGFVAGGGVEYLASQNMAWGAELLYQYIATSDEATNMLTLRVQAMFGYPR